MGRAGTQQLASQTIGHSRSQNRGDTSAPLHLDHQRTPFTNPSHLPPLRRAAIYLLHCDCSAILIHVALHSALVGGISACATTRSRRRVTTLGPSQLKELAQSQICHHVRRASQLDESFNLNKTARSVAVSCDRRNENQRTRGDA